MNIRKKLFKISIISFLFILFLLYVRDFDLVDSEKNNYLKLSDAFTITSFILIMVSILIIVINNNSLTGVIFVLKKLKSSLMPFNKENIIYKELKEKNSKFEFLSYLYVGLFYFIFALYFSGKYLCY